MNSKESTAENRKGKNVLSVLVFLIAITFLFADLRATASADSPNTVDLSNPASVSGASNATITATNATIPTKPLAQIGIADVSAAGFAGIKKLQPTATLYEAPTLYFTVSDPSAKSPTDDLLMISQVPVDDSATLFDYGTVAQSFTIANGKGQEAAVDNGQRTAINFIKDGMYVVLIGPYQVDLENLARAVAGKL